ncbi:hypothetical protein OROMI_017751 [Orobanche minor]
MSRKLFKFVGVLNENLGEAFRRSKYNLRESFRRAKYDIGVAYRSSDMYEFFESDDVFYCCVNTAFCVVSVSLWVRGRINHT